MSEACSMHRRDKEKCVGKLERTHMGNLDVDGRIILKWILKV
jgi:hypothetical protein